MSIQKFKSLSEAGEALWNFNPDKHYYEQVRALFKLATKLNSFFKKQLDIQLVYQFGSSLSGEQHEESNHKASKGTKKELF